MLNSTFKKKGILRGKFKPFKKILSNNKDINLYPIIINQTGREIVYSPSPFHGRSVVVDFKKKENKFIIIKGCGLTYYPYRFINTGEGDRDNLNTFIWGLLTKKDAISDYKSGKYISNLGILTNEMQVVLELEDVDIKNSNEKAHILQYSVQCPYRLADASFLTKKELNKWVNGWDSFKAKQVKKHLIVAEVLFKNLQIMHNNNVLHNAIHIQNYTLALELLDFELSRTPEVPYTKADELIFKDLFKREVFHCLEIINFICFLFKEDMDSKKLGQILKKYGYSI